MESRNKFQLLAEIQDEISVPKSRYNDFGKYSYRSYEDIVEAVKPVCRAHGATLTVTDEVTVVDGWHYVKATANITFWESGESVEVTAYAREAEAKKGSDVSQVTGMASTYARKYALCGLFSLDGQDDADSMDNRRQTAKSSKQRLWETIQREAGKLGLDPMEGVNAMKKWPDFDDSEAFYEGTAQNLERNPMEVLARMYPGSIEEVM